MILLYATDLHGDPEKYQKILDYAISENIRIIHLGADLLPKGDSILKEQKKFIRGFLRAFYDTCTEKGITVIGFFGNDDLYSRKKYFREYGKLLDEYPFNSPLIIDGYEFRAYPYCNDYPFCLKTATKVDYLGWVRPEQLGRPVDVDANGFKVIEDIEAYFKEKGTIEEDLRAIKIGPRTIMAIHCPPQGLSLDVCGDGKRVGSRSVFQWIEKNQPLACLCGHIHESPMVSGVWKAEIGKTLVIQPGQDLYSTTAVRIEISDPIKAYLLKL